MTEARSNPAAETEARSNPAAETEWSPDTDTVAATLGHAAGPGSGDESGANGLHMAPGDEFGDAMRFQVTRLIAHGGMGSVYEAVSTGKHGFEKIMTLKVLLPELSSRAEFTKRFVREARLVANLVHPHIVQIYHFGEVQGRLFIAMEYVHGPNLQDFILAHDSSDARVPEELAVYVASRVARALDYAHSRRDRRGRSLGIVHRDISPNNILISCEGEVKIADFGVARLTRGRHEDAIVVGKPQYIAPETLLSGSADHRADIFALGLVLWEILVGRPAYEDASFARMEILANRPEIPSVRDFRPDVPEEIDAIIRRATRLSPDARFASAGAMAQALEEALYRGGLGPTFVTLALHMAKYFPHLGHVAWIEHAASTTSLFSVVK